MAFPAHTFTRLCSAVLLLAGVLTAPGTARADMKTGVAAYKAGDYKSALREFTALAEKGDANAQFNLAILYLTGRGTDRDIGKSVEWHLKAAAQGLPAASNGLGVFYYQGIGVKQDYPQALKWFRRAAARGFADSEFNIGVMYFNSQGVRRDDFEVVKWVSLAAARKFAPAEHRLGQMYEKGVIFAKDPMEALRWYRLAAAHGNSDARAAKARLSKALNIRERTSPPAAVSKDAVKPVPKPTRKPAVPPPVAETLSEISPVAAAFSAPATAVSDADTPSAPVDGSGDTIAAAPPEPQSEPAPLTGTPAVPETADRAAPAGIWRVQFASFRTVAETERAWQTLLRRAGPAIGDIPRIVVRADLGDRGVFHRLQAGPFRDRRAATDLCKRVHVSIPGQGCLPVRNPAR
tara:strand:+ start:18343 stop:19560 length:1218 start_codon:yes stop_codon:yes gene_type:complete